MGSIFMRFPGGRSKALTLSYDDGVRQDRRLLEIMKKHSLRGTFNINSEGYAPEGCTTGNRMSRSEKSGGRLWRIYPGRGLPLRHYQR